MADDANKNGDQGRKERATGAPASAVARKAVEPIAAAAATAGAAYLTRKSSQLWQEKLAPKIREQGGARAAAEATLKSASETVAKRGARTISAITERGSSAFSTLADRVSAARGRSSALPVGALGGKPNDRREEERKERRRRRTERERALKRSGSS
jgi:hypothetical protein